MREETKYQDDEETGYVPLYIDKVLSTRMTNWEKILKKKLFLDHVRTYGVHQQNIKIWFKFE